MALRGGSFFADKQPSFSCDGRFLLVCTGCTVSVLSVATGLRVAELQGHTDRVTSIVVVKGLEEAKSVLTHAWTSSWDKTIRLWNFMTATQITVIDVGYKVVSMVIPGASSTLSDDKGVAFLSVAWDKEVITSNVQAEQEQQSESEESESDDKEESGGEEKMGGEAETKISDTTVIRKTEFRGYTGRVLLLHIASQKTVEGHLAKTSLPRVLVASRKGSFVGMADSAKVWVWKVPAPSVGYCSEVQATVLHPWQPLTVMAFDPTETLVAAADRRGLITVWKNVGERTFYSSDYRRGKSDSGRADANDDAESRTTYHWHHKEVACLSFTADGSYLLSGGREAVFVMWHIETGNQRFLPRLGTPFRYITSAPDPSVFVLSMADNSLRFLNIGSMRMDRVIFGIKPYVTCPDTLEWLNVTKVALHHVHGTVAVPTANLIVQFYDVLLDKHANQIQVSPRNFVSFDHSRGDFGQSTLVTHVAFSADASVMVTVDLRVAEAGVGGGSFLKFWTKSSENIPYTLHTSVDSPHGGEVLALAYHPSKNIAVTCSRANDFKLWVQTKNESKDTHNWRCSATGSYKQKRMHAAAFSHDGTLLAVAAEELITLWNPLSNTLVCVLSIPGAFHEVVGMLSFVPKCPYLISASFGKQPQLTVWNLSTLSVWWSYQVEVEGITVDPNGGHFAVLASSHTKRYHKGGAEVKRNGTAQVCLFKPESPLPTSVWDFKDGIGGALLFLPPTEEVNKAINASSSESKLLILNKHREYVIFDPYSESNPKPASKIAANAAIEDALDTFNAMYLTTNTSKPIAQHDQLSKITSTQPWGDLLNAPSHVLPSLTDIGQQILESFLQKKAQ
ncbi:WD repeat-containing protein 75 [Selaginella moellendorffii]|uniref:WD repeat-containing protein 75 n=1 Tax=Selaginella moellendorffii TaxID=88036 RepID=UPI000D1CCEC5|nr:WD repeat-containing protein 75 [Selaginella moellendorffii]|eukprot:XP_024528214.1 WD repeat-containing protein 75 [Selaginella moellendorffii]